VTDEWTPPEPAPPPVFDKPEYCADCPLRDAAGPVWGKGPEVANTMIFGEAPGAEEVDFPNHRPSRFAPFIGGSGRLLTSICRCAGIDRNTVFVSNIVKCRPTRVGDNGFVANRTPTAIEIAYCSAFAKAEVEAINPNVIIATGEVPLAALTGKEKIGLWRGVPIESVWDNAEGQPWKVFPTWHPAFIARAQYNWPFAVHDMVRASAQASFPEIRRVPFDIIRQASVATDGARVLADARARGAATFDFETTGLSARRDSIAMVGFAARSDEANVFDWSPGARALFQEILDDPGIELIGQNILYFDLPFAEDKGLNVHWGRKVFDTMVAFHLCNASYGQTPIREQSQGTFRARGMEKDLSMIASCHTDIPYWKSRDDYRGDLRKVCGTDCIATDRAAMDPDSGLKKELKQYDLLDLYYNHVLPVHPVLRRMTQRGVKIDEERGAKWSLVLEQQADELEATLKEGIGDANFSIDSPKQLMDLLYNRMGLPVQYHEDKHRGMRPSADAESLISLARMNPDNAILLTIIDIRQLRKLKATFVDPFLIAGRVHPNFGVSKTSTGRLNSWDPNAQNIPEYLRDLWIPDNEECVILAGDWSQIEWRLAMVMSGDETGLQLLSSGVDNHRAVAAEVLRKPISEVTDSERYSAKFIVYGLGYGRGAASIASGYDPHQRGRGSLGQMTMDFVNNFINSFFTRFSGFSRWRDGNVSFVKRNNYLKNPFNRRRWWYTWEVTEVYNFPQQSTAADMMYDALIAIDAALPKDATMRLTVHDEVVINCPKDCVKEAWRAVKECMEVTWPRIVEASARPEVVKKYYPNGWFCPADVHVGANWKQCKSNDPVDKAPRAALEKALCVGGEK
jgi:uracil-DNA glycosylase family 4